MPDKHIYLPILFPSLGSYIYATVNKEGWSWGHRKVKRIPALEEPTVWRKKQADNEHSQSSLRRQVASTYHSLGEVNCPLSRPWEQTFMA